MYLELWQIGLAALGIFWVAFKVGAHYQHSRWTDWKRSRGIQ